MSKFKIGERVLHKDKGEIGEIVGDVGRGWWSVKYFLSGAFSVHESLLLLALSIHEPAAQPKFNAENKYARELYSLDGERVMVDVYRVLDAFGVTDPAIQHAIKKTADARRMRREGCGAGHGRGGVFDSASD